MKTKIFFIIFFLIFISIYEKNESELKKKLNQANEKGDNLSEKILLEDNLLNFIKEEKITSNNFQYKVVTFGNKILKLFGPRAYLSLDKDDSFYLITGDGKIFKNFYSNNTINSQIIYSNLLDLVDENISQNNSDFIRGFLFKENRFYISYLDKIDKCTELILSEGTFINNKINFVPIFNTNECLIQNYTYNSGGALTIRESGEILITVGDFSQFEKPQDDRSLHGKIIEINVENKKYKILAKGIRNSLGIFYNDENSLIGFTEMGPKGGDEINLFKLAIKEEIHNFGWPLSSYGEHYDERELNNELLQVAPLHKSHAAMGFKEPKLYFTPSISTADILFIKKAKNFQNKNIIIFTTLGYNLKEGDMHLYIYEILNDMTLKLYDKIEINDRIRSIIYSNEKIYIFNEKKSELKIISN